jgi:hypothetical protein
MVTIARLLWSSFHIIVAIVPFSPNLSHRWKHGHYYVAGIISLVLGGDSPQEQLSPLSYPLRSQEEDGSAHIAS